MTADSGVPEIPENAKLKVGREPVNATSSEDISIRLFKVIVRSVHPVIEFPAASLIVSLIVVAVPPVSDFKMIFDQLAIPLAVEHAYLGANCEGCKVITGLSLHPYEPVD